MSLYSKITDNKYFRDTQRIGVAFGSPMIAYFLISTSLPITEVETVVVISILLSLWVILLKEYWGNNNLLFRKGSLVGIMYTIIGIPIALLISISLIVFFGWATLTVKAYQSDYDNAFDRIVVVYISPIVSIPALGYIIINNLQ